MTGTPVFYKGRNIAPSAKRFRKATRLQVTADKIAQQAVIIRGLVNKLNDALATLKEFADGSNWTTAKEWLGDGNPQELAHIAMEELLSAKTAQASLPPEQPLPPTDTQGPGALQKPVVLTDQGAL